MWEVKLGELHTMLEEVRRLQGEILEELAQVTVLFRAQLGAPEPTRRRAAERIGSAGVPRVRQHPKTALLVDDDPASSQAVARALENEDRNGATGPGR